MPREDLQLTADDRHKIDVRVFTPGAKPAGIVQILHGLGEHGERYARFAGEATRRGYVVAVHDHRGHGTSAELAGFFAGRRGWHRLISDALQVQQLLRERYPDVPITLLGHSMGSYVAQHFAMLHGGRIDALLLSASTWPSKIELWLGHILARLECWRVGARQTSALLDRLGFGAFNRKFQPARTDLDWLSRDPAEVDRYIDDPLCGGPFTAGLWRDLTGGLLEISSDNALQRIPGDLPVLITGGADDPVGGDSGMGKLATHYAQTGHSRLKVRIYPEGRHEPLNDSNRDEVTTDWLEWIAAHARTS
ncbi:MAG: alpha/beta hydrolase [Woeseiaceae bacterium]|nr:alpha/beta hydrolase [Woeseiaceae bacterium]